MSQPPTSKYPDMGEVTTLRLELNRHKDRADAFERALTKEVLAVIRKAAGDADTVGAQLVELDDIKAENARLKAEVERLKAVIESHKDAGKRLLAMLDEERRKNAAKEGKPSV